jgi:hypothetical protein
MGGRGDWNSRQVRTLKRLLATPTRSDITWLEVESLLRSSGAVVSDGSGSRKRVLLRGQKMSFHRPHDKVLPKYVVEDFQSLFLSTMSSQLKEAGLIS